MSNDRVPDKDVATIRRRALIDGEPIADLADEYGISVRSVSRFLSGASRASAAGPTAECGRHQSWDDVVLDEDEKIMPDDKDTKTIACEWAGIDPEHVNVQRLMRAMPPRLGVRVEDARHTDWGVVVRATYRRQQAPEMVRAATPIEALLLYAVQLWRHGIDSYTDD